MRNNSASSLQTVLTGIPVATASLYLLGVCFYQGFTRTLGLEESQFPLTVDRTLFDGFFALLHLSAPQIGYFVLAAEIIAFVALAVVILSTSVRVRRFSETLFTRRSNTKRQAESPEPPQKIAEFAEFAVQMFLFAVVVVLVIFGILISGIFADKSGQAIANNFLKKVEDGKQPSVDVFIVGQDKPIKAHTILCGSTHCAFIVDKKTITYRHEQIKKTIAYNISVNTDAMQ